MTVGSQLKQTYSSLKGARATLRIYANQGQQDETREAYREGIEALGEIMGDLEERIKKVEFAEPQYKGQ